MAELVESAALGASVVPAVPVVSVVSAVSEELEASAVLAVQAVSVEAVVSPAAQNGLTIRRTAVARRTATAGRPTGLAAGIAAVRSEIARPLPVIS